MYLIDELGFDAVVKYRAASNLKDTPRQACPIGVDVYFDNVVRNCVNRFDEGLQLVNVS